MAPIQGVFGVVLAAGQSTRMGRPKALLPCLPDAETFVARCVRVLRAGGVDDVMVVGRPEDDALRAEVSGLSPAPEYVENHAAGQGQLSSVVAAVNAAEARGGAAVVVLPVDLPRVSAQTVRTLIAAAGDRHVIVRASCGGRHGHPVIFSRLVFHELRSADPASGARAVVHADPSRVLNVEVDDPGVLHDIDLPEDYAAFFGDDP